MDCGLTCHRPYYNHIKRWENKQLVESVTYEDYSDGNLGNDVAELSFQFIMKVVQ